MSDKGDNFVQEFVLMFGFLGGIWLRTGISPEGAITDSLVEVIKSINPDIAPLIAIVFLILGGIFIIGTFFYALIIGGFLGVIAVILAYIGGYLLNDVGVFLLLIAVVIGWFAPEFT